MSAGYGDSLEEVKFLDSALKSSRPNVSIENKAIEIYRTFYKRGHFHEQELFKLANLQLLLQKLCRFDLALEIRDMFPLVFSINEITKSKIEIDNLTLPATAYPLLRSMRSKNDARSILSIMNLNQILGEDMLKAPNKTFSSRLPTIFLNRISGKRVAIVGPANIKEHRGSEIDSHDVVVRINIKGDDALPNFKSHGRKTDVIYLNGLWTDNFNTSNYQKLLASNCHFVWRKKKQFSRVAHSHSLVELSKMELSGSYLMLPRIVIDLLRFNPSSLSIFHNDFYAGEQIYEPGFRSERNAQEIWNLADHDLLTSLRFMNLALLKSKVPIKFIDLEFGEVTLNIKYYATLIQRRNLH